MSAAGPHSHRLQPTKGGLKVIVIGIDPHMKTHAAVALDAASGRSLGATSVGSDAAGCEALIAWARRLGEERLIASSPRRERGREPSALEGGARRYHRREAAHESRMRGECMAAAAAAPAVRLDSDFGPVSGCAGGAPLSRLRA